MTRRLTPGNFESLIDQQIREARANGAFDDLSTHGRPLRDLDRNRSAADVWLERKLAEEDLALPLPEGLQLRKDVAAALPEIRALADEAAVRRRLAALNAWIRTVNARHWKGPSSRVAPIDIDRFVAGWRQR